MGSWDQWYRAKGYRVEPEIPIIERFLKKKASSKILDIGCGHGRHVIYFARKGYDTYGIDNYKPIINDLKTSLEKHDLSAKLRVKDFTKGLPYPKNTFDLVIATRSIHHAKGKKVNSIFRGINRILKNSGILFLQVPSRDEAQKAEKIWIEYGKQINHKWLEPHTYVPLSGPEKGIPHHSFDKKELMHLLKNYKIIKLHRRKKHYHGYCLVARKII